MLELQGTVSTLKRELQFYADKINAGIAIPIIHPKDFSIIKNNLDNLIVQVKPYSETILNILQDIRNGLFVFQTIGVYSFNSYRFGALRSILTYLSSNDFICNYSKYIVTPWKDINDSIPLLLKSSATVTNRLEYNQVGVAAREVYLLLAQKVYDSEKLKNYYRMDVGMSDAKRILEFYLLAEEQNESLKKYIDSAISLADTVTHIKTADNKRLNTLIIAVISVIGLVNDKYRDNQILV